MGVCFNNPKDPEGVNEPVDQLIVKRRQNARLSTVPIQKEPGAQKADEQLNQLMENVQSIMSPLTSPENREKAEITTRTSVHGALTRLTQQGFEDKAQAGTLPLNDLNSMGIGIACKKGLKPESPNQDDFAVIVDPQFSLFCVFDGHGYFGHEISNYVKSHLPELLASNPSFSTDMQVAFRESFMGCHGQLVNYCQSSHFNCQMSGTTVTIAAIQGDRLTLGHVGDSRAVLGYKDNGICMARRLTTDHKPDLPHEMARIKGMNGDVKKLPDDIPYRVFKKNENGPGLSISRAIGDSVAQTVGVTSEPEVSELEVNETTEYLLVCSDGVWEFISDQEAIDTVSRFGSNCKLAAERLASMAWTRWIQEEEDIVDDITVLLVYLPSLKTVHNHC